MPRTESKAKFWRKFSQTAKNLVNRQTELGLAFSEQDELLRPLWDEYNAHILHPELWIAISEKLRLSMQRVAVLQRQQIEDRKAYSAMIARVTAKKKKKLNSR